MLKQKTFQIDYKLASPRTINLKNYTYVPRLEADRSKNNYLNFSIGASTALYGDKWFIIDGEKAIFKDFAGGGTGHKDKRIINEILCSQLAKNLNINSARYQKAEIHSLKGLVSYNFLKEGDELIPLSKLSRDTENFNEIVKNVLDYAKSNNLNCDKNLFTLDLFKMTLLDYLTLQTDRHSWNICFIKDKNSNLSLSPVFDNEYAFALLYNYFMDFSDTLITPGSYNFGQRVSPCEKSACFGPMKEAEELLKLCEDNKEFLSFYKSILNFDFDKFFETIISPYKFDDEVYVGYCKRVCKHGQECMTKAYIEKYGEDENEL